MLNCSALQTNQWLWVPQFSATQIFLAFWRSAAGKVLVVDEAYNLDDSLYGKQAWTVVAGPLEKTERPTLDM